MAYLLEIKKLKPLKKLDLLSLLVDSDSEFDMAQIIGQYQAKRALEIAAAGGHNAFMIGSPGSGKTMLARALPGIMPVLTETEAIEVTRIYSVTGNIGPGESIVRRRPFRAPHHTISRVGLVGGGSKLQPGEVSLAHRGTLFLDELSEFPRNVLEALRQPLEDGYISISRAAGSVLFPSKFVLVAASNPCPCGYLGHPAHPCHCLPGQIANYRKRLSGPIMDRIDIHLSLPPVEIEKLSASFSDQPGETSSEIRKRVEKARDAQRKRFAKIGINLQSNSEMRTKEVKEICQLHPESLKLLNQAAEKLDFSARSYFKIIKIAQTIADLSDEIQITPPVIAEALQYRSGQLDL
jgi:magnesium chelatase family protein